MTNVFQLLIGWSPNGDAVHSTDHVGDYPDLKAAQAAAGPGLEWTWMPERNVWRAETGHEQAAEIEPCGRLTGIVVAAAVMP